MRPRRRVGGEEVGEGVVRLLGRAGGELHALRQ